MSDTPFERKQAFKHIFAMKKIIPIILLSFGFLTLRSQTLNYELDSYVSNDSLFIEMYAENNMGVSFGFGTSNFPIYLDTAGLDMANMVLVEEGLWSEDQNFASYEPINFAIINDSVINVQVEAKGGSAVDFDPGAPSYISNGTQGLIAVIGIPILRCEETSVNWVPVTGILAGARTAYNTADVTLNSIYEPNLNVDPIVLSLNTLVVTSLADAGCGTLREAITTANLLDSQDEITFAVTGEILLDSPLPQLTENGTRIIGDVNFDCVPDIGINGTNLANGNGITINGADSCVIYGMAIYDFPEHGVAIINDAVENQVVGNHIGLDLNGVNTGNDENGVDIDLDSRNNLIGGLYIDCIGNVISDNSNGVYIHAGSGQNEVSGNKIGTSISGNADAGNSENGILIESNNNTIGSPNFRQTISGNQESGILIDQANGNDIINNIIGLNTSGNAILNNGLSGITIEGGAFNTQIGGLQDSLNVISGNSRNGITIDGSSVDLIKNNLIGTDITGTSGLGNQGYGIQVTSSSDLTIGGSSGEGNYIASNGIGGIDFNTVETSLIDGNSIGVGLNNTKLGNTGNGIYLEQECEVNLIENNTIAFNTSNGILYEGGLTFGNQSTSNSIYSNTLLGIEISSAAQDNIGLPTITDIYISGTDTIVEGTADEAGLDVFLYCDSTHEGQTFLASGTSVAGGNWSINISNLGFFKGTGIDSMTALQNSDAANSTSKFSAPFFKVACNGPLVDLGNDTTVCTSDSTELTLTKDFGTGSTYEWYEISSGDVLVKTATSNTDINYFVTTPGTYVVQVDSAGIGCFDSDTVVLTSVTSPTVSITNTDGQLCSNDTLELVGTTSNSTGIGWTTAGNGVFDDTSSINTNYYPTVDDATASNSASSLPPIQFILYAFGSTECPPATDTLEINFNFEPSVIIDPVNAVSCVDNMSLSATPSNNDSFTWLSSGSGSFSPLNNSNTTYTSDATDEGTEVDLIAEVTSGIGCPSGYDTVQVTFYDVGTDLGDDTVNCNTSIDISTALKTGTLYTWYDGNTNTILNGAGSVVNDNILTVTSDGTYVVEIEDPSGTCTDDDTIVVTLAPTIQTANVALDTVSATSVRFSWDAVPDVLDYTIFIDTCRMPDLSCTSITPQTVSSTTLEYEQTGLDVGDSATIVVRANGICDSTLSIETYGIADSCTSAFSGLESDYCTSSLKDILTPVTPGGTFTASPISSAVIYAPSPNDFWYFDPAEAGDGTHTIYYTYACASGVSTDSMVITVDPAPCVSTVLNDSSINAVTTPRGIYTGCDGNVFVTTDPSTSGDAIVMIDTFGAATIIAGDTSQVAGFEDGPVLSARLNAPGGLTRHPNGDLYFVSQENNAVRMVTYNAGTDSFDEVVTISGGLGNHLTSTSPVPEGYADGPGTTAEFWIPIGISFKQPGYDTLYISETGAAGGVSRLRGVELVSGNYNTFTILGDGANDVTIAPQDRSLVKFTNLQHITSDDEALYLADGGDGINGNIIAKWDYATDEVSIVVGTVAPSFSTDGNSTDARLTSASGISRTCTGDMYFTESFTNKIRKIDADTIQPDVYVKTLLNSGFDEPTAISVFVQGFVDVADSKNNDIKRFQIADYSTRPFEDLNTEYCIDDDIDTLFTLPCGSGYSGSGVTEFNDYATFNPAVAGVGTHILSYVYSQSFCGETITQEIVVHPKPSPDLGPDTSLCPEAVGLDSLIIDTLFTSYQWTVNNVSAAADTNYWRLKDQGGEFIVDVVDTNGCFNSDTIILTVVPTVVATIVSDMTDSVCYGTAAQLTVTNTGTGPNFTDALWNTGETTMDISAEHSGYYEVEVIDENGCIGETKFQHVMRNAPLVCIDVDPTLTDSVGVSYGDWTVSTIAGTGTFGTTDNVQGTNAQFTSPWGVTIKDNILYVSELGRVRAIDLADTMVTTFAGNLTSTTNDSIGRLLADFGTVKGIDYTQDDRMYVISDNFLVLIDLAKDSVFTVVGNIFTGDTDDTGSSALFNDPKQIISDEFGNVYIADFNNHKIRKIDPEVWSSTTIAGNGTSTPVDGQGTSAQFNWPWGITQLTDGRFAIFEDGGHVVRIMDLDTNVSTIAGQVNSAGFVDATINNKILGTSASLDKPWNAVADKSGNLYFTDANNSAIRILYADDSIATIAGNDIVGSADGVGGDARFDAPTGITYDETTGDLYVVDRGNHTIRKLVQNKTIRICAGESTPLNAACSNGANYTWISPSGVVTNTASVDADEAGAYIVQVEDVNGCMNIDSVIVEINALPIVNIDTVIQLTGGPSTIAKCETDSVLLYGNEMTTYNSYTWTDGGGTGTIVSTDTMYRTIDVGSYVLEVTDTNMCVNSDTIEITNFTQTVSLGGDVSICVGECHTIDPGPSYVSYLWSDSSLNQTLEVCAGGVFDVEVLTTDGCTLFDTIDITVDVEPELVINPEKRKYVKLLAGSTQGDSDNADPILAEFNTPSDVTVDSQGNLYIADFSNGKVKRIAPDGTVSTYLSGLVSPSSVAIDKNDNLFVSLFDESKIIKVTPGGIVSDYAGLTGTTGYVDGAADTAKFFHPFSIAIDENNAVYVADAANHVVRRIDAKTKMVTTIGVFTPSNPADFDLGGQFTGYSDGSFNSATFNHPSVIEVDYNGDVFTAVGGGIASTQARIREIDMHNFSVSTYNTTGNNTAYTTTSQGGLAIDDHHNIFAPTSFPFIFEVTPFDQEANQKLGSGLSGNVEGFDTDALIQGPRGIHFDRYTGDLYFVDGLGHRVRQVIDSSNIVICEGDSVELTVGFRDGSNVSPANLLWSTGETTTSIFAKTGGIYVATYTNPATSCTSVDSIFVTVNPIPTFSFMATDTTICIDDIVELPATATDQLDSIQWFNPTNVQLSSDIETDTAFADMSSLGTYTARVIDVFGCFDDSTVTVSVNDLTAIAGNVIGADTIANGICFGDSAFVDARLSSNGEPFTTTTYPYTYSWTSTAGPVLEGSTTEDSLIATIGTATVGTYSTFYVEVTDSLGCTETDSVAVYWNEEILVDAGNDTSICLGASVDLTAVISGGSTPYATPVWVDTASSAISNGNPITVSPMDTTAYIITVTDDRLCQMTDTVGVTPVELIVSAGEDTTICPNTDVLLTTTIISGVGNYSYTWTPAATLDDASIASPTATPLVQTEYIVTVYDSTLLCSQMDSVIISINDLTAIAGVVDGIITDTVAVCFNDSTDLSGALTSGGIPATSGYVYAWSSDVSFTGTLLDGSLETAQAFGGTEGDYNTFTLSVTDSVGCNDTDSMVVFWNPELIADVVPEPDSAYTCPGIADTLTGQTIGGSPNYTYSWATISGTASFNNTATDTFIYVEATDTSEVTFTSTDIYGCSHVDTVVVLGIDLVLDLVATKDTICPDLDDTLSVSVISGGVGPYNYVWNTGDNDDTTIVVATAPSSTYSVEVEDLTTGCVKTGNIEIVVIEATVSIQDTLLCYGDILNPPGVEIDGWKNPSFTWTGDSIQYVNNTSIQLPIITPGYYAQYYETDLYLTVTDSDLGCTVMDTLTITADAVFNAFAGGAQGSNSICVGDSISMGGILFNSPGFSTTLGTGTPPYTYSWTSTPTSNIEGSTSEHPYFVPTSAGSYDFDVVVTDSFNCVARSQDNPNTTFSPTYVVNDLPEIDLGPDTAFCEGTTHTLENLATVDVNDGYSWTAAATGNTPIGANITYTTSVGDTFALHITDDMNGCINHDTVVVFMKPLPQVTATALPSIVCANEVLSLESSATPIGGTFLWTTNATGVITTSSDSNTTYVPAPDTDPTPLTFEVFYTTECGIDSADIFAATLGGPSAGFTSSDTAVLPGGVLEFTDTSIGTIVGYEWAFGSGDPDSLFTVGPHSVLFNSPNNTNVQLVITDNDGCTDTAIQVINVINSKILYVPNVMSAQASSLENQVAKVYGINISPDDFHYAIYNRWGELIWETSDFTEANTLGWNGVHQQTGKEQDAGVYTYTLNGKFFDETEFSKTGTITIIK